MGGEGATPDFKPREALPSGAGGASSYKYTPVRVRPVNRRLPLALVLLLGLALVVGLVIASGIPLPALLNPSIPPNGYIPAPPGPNWTELQPGLSPSSNDSMMTYVPSVGGLMLVTGSAGCGASSTWVFEGGVWVNLTRQVGPGPSPGRGNGGLVYDTADNYAVFFGGASGCGVFNDTWTFSNNTWSRISTPVAPPPLYSFSMTYDASDGYVLLTGGCCIAGADARATWAFHAGAWTNVTSGPGPVVDADSAMTYDAALGEVVFVGGYASGYVAQSTWTYHAGTWVRLFPAISPSNRAGLGLAYDTALGRDVLVGGYTKVTTGVYVNLTDTWQYENGKWQNLTATLDGTPPFVTSPTLVAYDPPRDALVLFAGPGETWEFK